MQLHLFSLIILICIMFIGILYMYLVNYNYELWKIKIQFAISQKIVFLCLIVILQDNLQFFSNKFPQLQDTKNIYDKNEGLV